MKTITNLLLVLALTASIALADGHTAGGDRCSTCTPPPCETCLTAPESDTQVAEEAVSEDSSDGSIYEYWKELFMELFY